MEFRFASDTIKVNVRDKSELEAKISDRLARRSGFALATLNLDHLSRLRKSSSYRTAYLAQDFVVADGNPIVWLSKLSKKDVELLPGSDLVLPLLAWACRAKRAVALVGSSPAALDAAAARMIEDLPGLEIALKIAPSMGFDPDGDAAGELLETLAQHDIGLTLLALGSPKQELLAARGRTLAPNVGFASIGAGLDFIAGKQTRAPLLVRRLALEWAWRLIGAPRRLGMRYLRSAAVLPYGIQTALKQRGE